MSLHRATHLVEKRPRGVDVSRPPQLMRRDVRGPVFERPADERTLEPQRLVHLGDRDAESRVEVEQAVRRERAAANRVVTRSRCRLDCVLSVLEPARGAVRVPHQRREPEVDLGDQRIVSLRLVESVAKERHGLPGADSDSGQLRERGR